MVTSILIGHAKSRTSGPDGSKKRFGDSEQGRGGLQVTQRLRSTHPRHTQEGNPPTYKGAVICGLGCQSDEPARVAVKRH